MLLREPLQELAFNNVLSSQISWNTSTYKWTVPVAGLYNFSGAIRLNAHRAYMFWVVDTYSHKPVKLF